MAMVYHIIALLGGLAMFLYGMRVMGDGLKSNSGGTMKTVLAKVTNKPWLGFLLGVIVTCVIQSSTATIVLTVGLVGAGFLTFRQSIGVVLGANVGTAITAQIIRLMDVESGENSLMYFFKADNLAPLALVIGMVILMTTKRESKKNIGNVACGFGVLFMGLIAMSGAVEAFEESLSGLLTAFSNNYILGFGAGVLVTGVIQSSSAVVGIIQSVASTMGVTFGGVFAVIMGVNIGDCLTTFLVSRIGARPEQIRTAVVHVVYNVLAATLIAVLLTIGRTTGILNGIWNMSLNSGGVANVHGLFRIIPAVLLLPLSPVMAKITEVLVPDKKEAEEKKEEFQLRELDPHLVTSPILAMDQVQGLLVQMHELTSKNFEACSGQIYAYDEKVHDKIREREDMLDQMTDAIGQYLVLLTPHIRRDRDFRTQNYLIKSSVCLERVGDAANEVVKAMRNMHKENRAFSQTAKMELQLMLDAVKEIMELTGRTIRERDLGAAERIEPLEEVIDDLGKDMNSRHVYRMAHNACDVFEGMQFQNIIANLEKISDQCSDISVYVTELTDEEIRGHEHDYIHKLHHSVDSNFQSEYQADRQKYYTRLMDIPAIPGEGSAK